MKHLTHSFQNSKLFENRLNHSYWKIHTNMAQNEHVYAICCQPEVAGDDVISSENVNTVDGYATLNFEVASFSSFRDIQKKIISWRRRQTLTIALSENAFAFRLKKTIESQLKFVNDVPVSLF